MNSTPTLPVSRGSLPPEGAQSALGRPGGGLASNTRTRIKICGLTREQDVDAAVAAGADAVGFVLYPKSPRYVTAERAGVLARRLPPFVTPVLLFVNADADTVAAACAQVPGALLQFHGDETPKECVAIATRVARPFMRAARIPLDGPAVFDLVEFASHYAAAQAILLDAHVEGFGGGGKTFNWSRLPPSVNSHLVLSGGLTPANVTDGILQLRPRGLSLAVDISSGVEISKGAKDADKIHQFVAAVRAADRQLAEISNHDSPANTRGLPAA
jgi:phosphoribosylanthranilate isomerase